MAAEEPVGLDVERTLRAISAALDGEGQMPDVADPEALDDAAAVFHATAVRLRQAVRLQEAEVPPDLTAEVMAEVAGSRPRGGWATRAGRGTSGRLVSTARGTRSGAGSSPPFTRRQVGLVAGVAFLTTAVVTALALAPGWRGGEGLAAADVGEQLLAAQRSVTALDAAVVLVEQGVHPTLPVRRYEGTLRYRAPEQLWLSLQDVSALPRGWPANDIDLVIEDGRLVSTGLRDCPVADQPACLDGPTTRTVVGLPPFAADVQAPLDLIVPVGGFLPLDGRDGSTALSVGNAVATATAPPGQVAVEVTVAQVQPLLDALTGTGALRHVHPSDEVSLRLDAEGLGLRGLSVRAAHGDGRATWAAANGYRDRPGDPLLDLRLTPTATILPRPPAGPGTPDVDAGFVDDAAAAPVRPHDLPAGFAAHRTGHLRAGGPLTQVAAYSDGRAWLRVDATASWDAAMLFGDLGPLVRAVDVGEGTGYTTPEGDAVALRGDGWDVVVTGSLPLAVLLDTAASLRAGDTPLVGRPLPPEWAQAQLLTQLPRGALAPDGPLTARQERDGRIVVAVPGAGGSGARLVQQPTDVPPPPVKGDVVEVVVRGVPGRWSAPLGLLTWVEDGWGFELTSEGLDLDGLLAVAEALG
ncbi:MAG TPA: hypothetical protein VMM13_01370 [Euzebya sp.]|nr:hypothetical protein [Euzebya sp.]